MNGITRRRFMRRSLGSVGAAAMAGSLWRPRGVKAAQRGANEKIRVGLIGSGGMGRGDLSTFLQYDDVECVAVCDVDDRHIAATVNTLDNAGFKEPATTKDFRTLIDRNDVDACIVATPDHWHALPTVYACQAGKDVYVEKPLATSVGEGKAMLDAARKHNRVVQMGTQWRSSLHHADAVACVQSGKLGKIRQVRCWAYLNWVHSVGKPADCDPPAGVDYNMWLGPSPERPFNPARFHFSFRWFWDYAGGLMTDWGVHLLNIALWGMNAKFPRSVSSTGGKYIYDDISDTPDTQHALYDYGDFTLIWEHQMTGDHGCENREHGVAFHGTEAVLIVWSTGWEVIPLTKTGADRKPVENPLPAESHGTRGADARARHVRNFLDCVRSRQRPVEDVEIGHHVSTAAHLGNLALRSRQSIQWDTEKQCVVDRPDLDELVNKPYRKPWKLEV